MIMACKFDDLSTSEKISLRKLPQVQATNMFNSAVLEYEGKPVKVDDMSSDGKRITLKGGKVVNLNKDSGLTVNGMAMDSEAISTLFSDLNFVMMPEQDYVSKAVNASSSSKVMKDIAEELASIDTTLPQKDKDMLLNSLGVILDNAKEVLPAMNVMLNDHANENGGVINFREDANIADVFINVGSGLQERSALEAYVHEVWHAATEYAIRASDHTMASVRRELLNMHKAFLKETKPEDLAKFIDHPDALRIAQDMLDYFHKPQVSSTGTVTTPGLREFIVYSQTNPAVVARLKEMNSRVSKEEHKNLFSRMAYYARVLMEKAFGITTGTNKAKNDYERMAILSSKLVEANYYALQGKRQYKMGLLEGFMDKIDGGVSHYMEKYGDKISNKPLGTMEGKSKFGKALFAAKVAGRALVDESVKKAILNAMSMMGMKPWESIQMLLKDMMSGDEASNTVEQLQLHATTLDEAREWTAANIAIGIKAAFNGEISPVANKAMNDLMDVDIATLRDYTNFEELLRDKKVVSAEIDRVTKELEKMHGKDNTNYYKWQAEGLARFMKDSKEGHAAQLRSAEAIADRVNDKTVNRIAADSTTVRLVDELISLYGLSQMDNNSTENLLKALEEHPEGISTSISYLQGLKNKIKDELYNKPANRYDNIKGDMTEVFDRNSESQLAPMSKRKEMEKAGFVLVEEIKDHPAFKGGEPLGNFVNMMPARQALHKTTFRYTDAKPKGSSLVDLYRAMGEPNPYLFAERDVNVMRKEVKVAVENARNGVFTVPPSLKGAVPLTDKYGLTVDYRLLTSKEAKLKHMTLNTSFAATVGATYGRVIDRVSTPHHNKRVVEFLKKEMKNFIPGLPMGADQRLYTKVDENSKIPGIKELWGLLPQDVKDQLPKGFHIREDLLLDVMGYREKSMSDNRLTRRLSPLAKRNIRVAETLWKEVVKMAKQTILLKLPVTLLSNVTSATAQLLVYGIPPHKAIKLQLDAVRELNDYRQAVKTQMQLKPLIDTKKATAEQVKAYNMSFQSINNSPIKDLMDAGFYTQIMEDLEHTGGQGVIESKIKGIRDKAPVFVRNGLNWSFMTSESPAYQLMETATQYSDFVARYAAYQVFTAKGMKKEEAITKVRNAFVNYVKPNSPWVEYWNQMGLVMFTKYFTRVQRALKEMVQGHPIRALLFLAAQEYLLGDIADPTDASIFVKDFTNLVYNPIGVLTMPLAPHGLNIIADVAT